MIFLRIFFCFLLFTRAIACTAQGGMSIKATADKDKILIGEPFLLTVQYYFSPESVHVFNPPDTIANFEVLAKPEIDTLDKIGGLTVRVVYKLTSFDSGRRVIPAFFLSKEIRTDTLPVDVVFSAFNPEQDYHEIKDIIEVKEKKKNSWVGYLVAGAIFMLLLIYFFWKRGKRPPMVITKPSIDPFQEAMRQLEDLQKQNLFRKEFHTGLVEIFKRYVLVKKNILTLQETTEDLVLRLYPVIQDKELYNLLQQTLRLSDFVKFAKYQSNATEDQQAFSIIKKIISQIEES